MALTEKQKKDYSALKDVDYTTSDEKKGSETKLDLGLDDISGVIDKVVDASPVGKASKVLKRTPAMLRRLKARFGETKKYKDALARLEKLKADTVKRHKQDIAEAASNKVDLVKWEKVAKNVDNYKGNDSTTFDQYIREQIVDILPHMKETIQKNAHAMNKLKASSATKPPKGKDLQAIEREQKRKRGTDLMDKISKK